LRAGSPCVQDRITPLLFVRRAAMLFSLSLGVNVNRCKVGVTSFHIASRIFVRFDIENLSSYSRPRALREYLVFRLVHILVGQMEG